MYITVTDYCLCEKSHFGVILLSSQDDGSSDISVMLSNKTHLKPVKSAFK
jgi:hypothetical protein